VEQVVLGLKATHVGRHDTACSHQDSPVEDRMVVYPATPSPLVVHLPLELNLPPLSLARRLPTPRLLHRPDPATSVPVAPVPVPDVGDLDPAVQHQLLLGPCFVAEGPAERDSFG
jgi:hypothetical protein